MSYRLSILAFISIVCIPVVCVARGKGSPGPITSITQMKEAEIAERAVVSSKGKTIRMIETGVAEKEAVVVDTPIGRAVILPTVPERAICHILIDAENKDEKPVTPELDQYWGSPSYPVKLDNSCEGKMCIWAVMAQGEACKVIADSKYYKASSMEEILSSIDQERMLVTEGNCDAGHGKTFVCNVQIDDPRAIPGKPWWVPHAWAGRDADFNFEQAQAGRAVDKYRVDETGEVKEVNPNGEDGKSVPIETDKVAEPIVKP